ncbi:hypothetical protein ANAPH2_00495 [Anaplasma phagocytophilum]|nr:hypothetical protein ANAPH2_00495 [Anaplasma phagocytophilum]
MGLGVVRNYAYGHMRLQAVNLVQSNELSCLGP